MKARQRGRGEKRLSLLELDLEAIKRFGNISLKAAKYLYDGFSAVEGYVNHDVEFHAHLFACDRTLCALYRAVVPLTSMQTPTLDETSLLPNCYEMPVLVWIRKPGESLRPLASRVRLQSLDSCDMLGVDVLKPGLYTSFSEHVLEVFDRKLRAILRQAGVFPSKSIDEVIKRGPEVVDRLSKKNAKDRRHITVRYVDKSSGLRVDKKLLAFFEACHIEMDARGPALRHPKRPDSPAKILNMFLCPIDPGECGIEFVRHEVDSAHVSG